MNLLFRFITTFFRSVIRSKIGLFDESRLTLRVWLNDFDPYLHLNNGRYLSLMDLGRLDLVIRNGLGSVMLRRKWFPVVGSSMIRYRRPVHAFHAFQLCTSLAGWDDKWIYVAHRFEENDELMAAAIIQGVFRGSEGTISPQTLFRNAGYEVEAVRMPQWILDWQQADGQMKNRAHPGSRDESSPED